MRLKYQEIEKEYITTNNKNTCTWDNTIYMCFISLLHIVDFCTVNIFSS